jgi:methyl-accepting chemotaxis protein
MSQVMTQSSEGLLQQNQEINQVVAARNQMSAAIDEVARNAVSASNESKTRRKPHIRVKANLPKRLRR